MEKGKSQKAVEVEPRVQFPTCAETKRRQMSIKEEQMSRLWR